MPVMLGIAPALALWLRVAVVTTGVIVLASSSALAQSPVSYTLAFPEPEHRWAQVEVVFAELPSGTLEVRMSRTSPGRYALHEFAKNVYDVRAVDGAGRALSIQQPNLHQWNVTGHDGTVRLSYRVFGDRTDGTYLAIDTTHAHLNMPATLVWARGLDRRPVRVRFEPPADSGWRVATQLAPTDDPFEFTAPNLQYLLDSPTELSDFSWRTFQLDERDAEPTFRVALHHEGTEAEADAYARDTERIVREAEAVFGEFPSFDYGTYTFLVDYVPYASGDGMEHRNSTVLSSSGALADPDRRRGLLGTVAHEFVHAWNVERIRPSSLEPFDFEAANVSGELWLAEGFTSYYGALLMHRAGLTQLRGTGRTLANAINTVTMSPGRELRSAVEMSRLAPFVDAARSVDRTNRSNTFISYYTWGSAIGLGLDLFLRQRSDGAVTLDDYMKAMWVTHGLPDGEPGYVVAPYTLDDARDRLAEVSGDPAFAADVFERYVEGHEVIDYEPLLRQAGLVVRKRDAGQAWLGNVRLEFDETGAKLTAAAPFGSPIFRAGLGQDDVLVSIDGEMVRSRSSLDSVLESKQPGDNVRVTFLRRGREVSGSLGLEEDPRVEIVAVESTGTRLSDAERAFREAWLGSQSVR